MSARVAVRVLFFAHARELSGLSRTSLEVPQAITVRQLLDTICGQFNLQKIRNCVILSVDEEYCDDLEQSLELRNDCEIAVIPPISGG